VETLLQEVLVGGLLGDFNLQTGNGGLSYRLRCGQCAEHKDYLFHVYDLFKDRVETPSSPRQSRPLAFALYLFEVSAKPRQSRNPFRGIPPFRQSRNPVRGREERRILLLYLIRGVPPIKGGIKNPWRSRLNPLGVRPKASGKAKILVRIEDSHPGKATPYGVGRRPRAHGL
jgi:hypothetical protein